MLRQRPGQADGLAADVLPDQAVAAGGLVAFVEQQVKRVQHAVEPPCQLLALGDLKRNLLIANLLLRACQPLGDRRLGGEEGAADFRHAEAAQGLQGQRDLRLVRNARMAAHKHQPQAVVGDLLVTKNRLVRAGHGPLHHADNIILLVVKHLLAPHHVERQVARRAHDPGGRILRHAAERPRLQGPGERLLHHVLRKAEVFDPEDARQRRDHLARLMTEKMVHHLGHISRGRFSRMDRRIRHVRACPSAQVGWRNDPPRLPESRSDINRAANSTAGSAPCSRRRDQDPIRGR